MSNPMKIHILSNAPFASTGYGNQVKIFAPRMLADSNDVKITCLYGLNGGVLNWNGIPLLPNYIHPYGQDIIGAQAEGCDVMISLMDAWVCEPERFPSLRWVPWFPIDHEPLQAIVKNKIIQAYHRITMSKFGSAQMDDSGLDYSYVPHGIETKVYTPIDRLEAREKVGFAKDAFVIGMVAANKGNPSRKAFCQQLAAFAIFKRKHSDAIMYIHTCTGAHGEHGGVDLPEYCQSLGLKVGTDVLFPNQFQNTLGFPDDWMNALYNSFDVFSNVSLGEGFGIPIVEAQSAGCPVIVGDWTAMSELCFSGWKINKADAQPCWTQYGAYWFSPNVDAIADKYEQAYHKKGNQIYRDRARTGALDYDADLVYEKYWKPTLELLATKIEAEPKHNWAKIGLFNKDGSMSIPCLDCNDEKVGTKIIPDGFNPVFSSGVELNLVPDDDGISKIVCREIERDYQLDNLDLKPGDVVLDIGAHKGIVSCYLAKRYPGIRLYSYEPHYANFVAMTENIKCNEVEDYNLFNMAVTKDGRSVSLDTSVDNSGGCSIVEGDRIESISFQSIFNLIKSSRVALLKIDCEGSEFEILQNAGNLLDRIDHLRGEFHKSAGNVDALMKLVKAHIPDVHVTVQG